MWASELLELTEQELEEKRVKLEEHFRVTSPHQSLAKLKRFEQLLLLKLYEQQR